jgi:CopG antitoxin of type II toxin-antitoxin system
MTKTTMKPDGPHDRVPTFANEQEAAAFWDTHSPLDFPDDFEEVEIAISRPTRKRGLTVKLDQATIEKLAGIAREQGIGPSTLARMWILEHLRSLPPEPDRERSA